jgi:hypothetical protein
LQASTCLFDKTARLTLNQCAIPVFDGLLPEPYNTKILQLLFLAAHWHGLAKLRMHTDSTLDILDSITSSLGKHLREFRNETCSAFNTRELRREADARVRRQASQKNPSTRAGSSSATNHRVTSSNISGQASNTRREKVLNLNTYKVHALGDYSSTIRRYGTTDSYTTESVNNLSFLTYPYCLHITRVNGNIVASRHSISARTAKIMSRK